MNNLNRQFDIALIILSILGLLCIVGVVLKERSDRQLFNKQRLEQSNQ